MHYQRYLWGLGGVCILAAFAFIPILHRNIITSGIDEYEYHRPLFGNVVQSQDVQVSRELRGVGAILVNLRRTSILAPVEITITDRTSGNIVAETQLMPVSIIDDAFAIAYFDRPLTGFQDLRITFSSRQATKDNPVGIRFHPDNAYLGLSRYENVSEKSGALAVALIERVSLWRFIAFTVTHYPARTRAVSVALVSALVISLITLKPGWKNRPVLVRRGIELGILLTVGLAAVTVRLMIIPYFYGVSGGDPYNYLFITQKLAAFENPFEGVKRLPGFPALLLPAFLTAIDDIWWMRSLNALAAGVSISLTAMLARQLRLGWPVQVIAAALLVLHKDFLWTSVRPEPYTVYTALLLGVLVLFFQLRHRWAQVLFGVLLGSAAMTRQEGFVVAFILGCVALVMWRRIFNLNAPTDTVWQKMLPSRVELLPLLKKYATTFGPALVIVLPFFLNNLVTFGNPLYTQYFEGERLQIVDSWNAFLDSAGATWGVIGAMWRPSWDELFRIPLTDPYFAGFFLITLVWWLFHFLFRGPLSRPLALVVGSSWLAVALAGVYFAITAQAGFSHAIMAGSAGILAASGIPFLAATRWRGAIVVVIALSQLLIALWFHPFPKHFQQVYPFLILLFVAGLLPASKRNGKEALAMPVALALLVRTSLLLPLFLVSAFLFESLNTELDQYNNATAVDNIIYRAVRGAQKLPGPHGFDQGYLAARLYFTDAAHYYTADEEKNSQKELEWAAAHHLRTMVTTSVSQTILRPPPHWEKIASFKAEGRNEVIYESTIYNIPSVDPTGL